MRLHVCVFFFFFIVKDFFLGGWGEHQGRNWEFFKHVSLTYLGEKGMFNYEVGEELLGWWSKLGL